MAADKVWLRDSLAEALGWDPSVAEEVVEAISSAQGKEERDEIVEGYLGGGQNVSNLVDRFLRSSRQQAAGGAVDVKGRKHRPGERKAGSMTIRHVAGRAANIKGQSNSQPALPTKEVCNCISCGKIYFTASDTADNVTFVESGGFCTFCGAQVALSDDSCSQPKSAVVSGHRPAPASSDGAAPSNDQTAAAVAFKDRLVDYDRNARQRTTVVDDQNDFFEIDTNAWLEPEEREQLKQQEKAMQEAEEARRKRVTVTFDLLGRQVLLADEAPPTQPQLESAKKSATAAQATAAQRPHGGGTAARSAMQAASRIQPNTSLKTERPMFVPSTPETREERQRRRGLQPSCSKEEEAPQTVIGGWGDEKLAKAGGSGMSMQEAQHRKAKTAEQTSSVGTAAAAPAEQEFAQRAVKSPLSNKKAKRPQLKRLQHDDPFEGVDMLSLDDLRPEEVAVQ